MGTGTLKGQVADGDVVAVANSKGAVFVAH